jgi:hypothetical protein
LQFKTLQTKATNSLSLKGLLLIAQFNFQRAAGVATQKLDAANSNLASHLGDKKPERRITSFNSASQIRVIGRKKLCFSPPIVNILFDVRSAQTEHSQERVKNISQRRRCKSNFENLLIHFLTTDGRSWNRQELAKVGRKPAERPSGRRLRIGRADRPSVAKFTIK